MADPGFIQVWVIDGDVKSFFRIGVVGNGGSGKTLLLKGLFSSQKKEDAKMWLNQRIQAKMFALFLDDVWGEGGKLLQELGVALRTDHSNSKIIVSSRDRRAVLGMGVSENSMTTTGDLVQEKCGDLLPYDAFPCNNGNLVCAKFGGLPVAIKLLGRSMTDAHEWQSAVQSQKHEALYDSLEDLQLCFLYLAAAFIEDQVIYVEILILLWIGEGLLATLVTKNPHEPIVV